MITIYHNTRCGKSRECLAYLEKSNRSFEIVNYLDNRTKEKIWIEQYKGKPLTEEDVITAILENPILMERPVVVYNDKAIIARPLSLIESLF